MNISKLKKEVTLCIIIIAVVAELVSIPFLGWNILFSYGLAIGTVVGIVNTNILTRFAEKAIAANKPKLITYSYILRMVIYGGAFLLSVKTATVAGIGTAIGFIFPQIAMYIIAGILPKIRRHRGLEESWRYETDSTKKVFEKAPSMAMHYNGRFYKTHRRFRVVKRVFEEKEV